MTFLTPGYEATTVGGDTRSGIVPEMIPVFCKETSQTPLSQTFSADETKNFRLWLPDYLRS